MDEERRHDLIALALLTAIVALLFIDVLAGSRILAGRDLIRYSYPTKKVLRDVVLGGEFPYWNRSVSAGQPMAANPAHEVFYPLTWLILLPGFDYGFQLFIALHLLIAAWGMYALLRSLALSPASAFLGALSFGIGGLMLSYITILPFLASVAWMPFICLFARRFVSTRSRRDLLFAALFFALQVLIGEPTTLLQTGTLLGLYAIAKRGARGLAPVAILSVVALLLGAVQALPMLDHARDSVRATGIPYETVVDWSTPPARIGELVYPHFFGHTLLEGRRVYWGSTFYGDRVTPFLFSIYPGLIIIVCAVAGFIAKIRGARLVLASMLISFLLALGKHVPIWEVAYDAGIAKSIRYPEKFLLLGLFALTVFGARALDAIIRGDERVRGIAMRVVIVVTAFATLCAIVTLTKLHELAFIVLWQARPYEWVLAASRNGWWIAVARGVLLFVLFRALPRTKRATWIGIAALFILLDLAPLVPELAPRSEPDFLRTQPDVLRPLPPNHSEYRLFHHAAQHVNRPQVAPYFAEDPDRHWVFRNAALPLIPLTFGIQTAIEDDFDSTSLASTADFSKSVWELAGKRPDWVNAAAAMSNVWYRAVFIDPDEAFAKARGDRRVLQPVRILTLQPSPRYSFAEHIFTIRDRADFVRRLATGPYVRTAYIAAPAFAPAPGRVLAVHETANTARIDVETAGRAFLNISVTPHKYWRITIDDREAPAIVTNIGYQGVIVPSAGRHVIAMRYRNPLIPIGAAISLLTLFVLLARAYRALERAHQ